MFIPPFVAFCGAFKADEPVLRSHADRVRKALEMCGLTEQDACRDMNLDQAQWLRQLKGEGHISLTRMTALPDEFWQWMGVLLAEDYGIPKIVVRAGLIWLGLRGRKQLRMTAERPERRIA